MIWMKFSFIRRSKHEILYIVKAQTFSVKICFGYGEANVCSVLVTGTRGGAEGQAGVTGTRVFRATVSLGIVLPPSLMSLTLLPSTPMPDSLSEILRLVYWCSMFKVMKPYYSVSTTLCSVRNRVILCF
jgi:hypothetical protein